MPQVEILVCETFTIDRNAARPVPLENVAALDHKFFNNAVERCFEVAGRLRTSQKLSGAHPSKVLGGFWRFVTKELHLYSSTGNSTNGNVEEHHRIAPRDGVEDDRVRHGDGHGFARGAAGGLRRSEAWQASRFCNARFGDRRTQRGVASARRGAARQAVPNEAARLRAATKLAGVDARV